MENAKQFYCQEFDTGSTLENLPVQIIIFTKNLLFC